MKKIAIRLAVAFTILSLVISTALATTYLDEEGKWKLLESYGVPLLEPAESPADSIGREVRLYLKEWASKSTSLGEIFRQGILIKVTLKWYLVESDDVYYWIPVENIALIEVIK